MKGYIILAVIILILLYVILCYNKIVRKKIVVEEAFSTMDVYLKKRFDMIPNLVETVKGYAKHESETLSKIVGLRGGNYSEMSDDEKIKNSIALSREIPKILALAEAYPDLKANQNFMNLSSQLQKMEDDIANARKYYNGAVKSYNILIQTIPTNIIAALFHFDSKKMYEVSDAQERENVQVKF